MKVLVIFFALNIFISGITLAQGFTCATADPFAANVPVNFPASVDNGNAEAGPNYGCLSSRPNPAWYFMMVDQSGPISLHMYSEPQRDIDFVCWGPFTSYTAPCSNQLTATCTSCPNNTSPSAAYPYGNLVDCSYSTNWTENCNIPNAVSGEFYIFMITNYSNYPCNIVFEQTNINATMHGTTSQAFLNLTGIEENDNANKLQVFPIPFSDKLSVITKEKNNIPVSAFLCDITGKIVWQGHNLPGTFAIDRAGISGGTYILQITGTTTQRKVVVVE